MSTVEKPKAGLEDTVATSSAICYLDGDRGVLAYCGYDIHDLARQATFEEVCYLLWHRRLPTRAELGDLQSQLIAARPLPEAIIRLLHALPPGHGMDTLRTLTSALGHYDADAADNSSQANYRKAVRLTAQISSLVATIGRMARGQGPIDPDPVLGHAANFLYMLTGDRPSGLATHAFDVALTLHADHELNASTFAARVAAATLTDIHSAIVAAICALKGPTHGGANEAAMRMLEGFGSVENVPDGVRQRLEAKQTLFGFGHPVYVTLDPRARILKRLSEQFSQESDEPQWYALTEATEREVMDQKGLAANVDLYSGSVYRYLGIPNELFTPIFECSRVAGQAAHALEQHANNKIIRPAAEYVGPEPRDFPVPAPSR
jgi:2-methylcitrate synthase